MVHELLIVTVQVHKVGVLCEASQRRGFHRAKVSPMASNDLQIERREHGMAVTSMCTDSEALRLDWREARVLVGSFYTSLSISFAYRYLERCDDPRGDIRRNIRGWMIRSAAGSYQVSLEYHIEVILGKGG